MKLSFAKTRRAVGLDIGTATISAVTLESRGTTVTVTGMSTVRVQPDAPHADLTQAINAALAEADADDEPVVTAIGGAEVVIRHISLPPLPAAKIVPALEFQHRELGLLAPEESVLSAQVLRSTRDGAATDVLAVSVPRKLVEDRLQLLERAAVKVKLLDVEPLALLNGALHLTGLEPGEVLVAATIERQSTTLCLFSESGPVVARYLDVGADHVLERLRVGFELSPYSVEEFARTLPESDALRAEEICRGVTDLIAEHIRLSLAFYRSEFDRDALPRYALAGWAGLPLLARWLADRVGLTAPLEVMDPLLVLPVRTRATSGGEPAPGPQLLQAFGLALRGL